MAAAIPVDTKDICSIVNLPADMAENPIWAEHSPLVMARLAEICTTDAYDDASGDDPSDVLAAAFRIGYAFLALESTAEFLNLKTIGEGIVKTVGLDQSATELLTGHEIEAFKAGLEKRALQTMKPYLNAAGRMRLEDLSPRAPRVMRAGVV